MVVKFKGNTTSIINRFQVLLYRIADVDNGEDKMLVLETRVGVVNVLRGKLKKKEITKRDFVIMVGLLIGFIVYFIGGAQYIYKIAIKEGIFSIFIPLVFYMILMCLFVYFYYKEKTYILFGKYQTDEIELYLEDFTEASYIKAFLDNAIDQSKEVITIARQQST